MLGRKRKEYTPMVYRKIYHLSDIHIRLFSRRIEYEQVFQKTYDYLRTEKHPEKCVVVLTGDILHNKIDLQPECTMMTYEFLRELGSIMTTILIAGNHDALLNNRDRIDSLTSILYDRLPPHVFYYTKTGVYRHDNLVLVVNSLLDDQWIKASELVRENASDILLGLYHGQIHGWRNNQGYVSDTGEKQVSDFEGCDYVLLGDIHKHQYMNATKTMAYAGSLISQNFGETDDDHGVLVWDLVKKTSRLHRISNDYAYKDFHATENAQGKILFSHGMEWKEVDDACLPPKGNVKIFLAPDHGLHLPSILRKRFPSIKFQFQVSNAIASTDVSSTKEKVEVENDETLLSDYLAMRWPQESPAFQQRLKKDLLDDFYQHRLQAGSTLGWQLDYLHFENLFGYGPDNRLDLNTSFPKHTVTGIFGNNSAGKSTLIDILALMLYNKITRSSHGNSIPKEVIHFKEKSGWGEVGLRLGSTRYVLRKVYTRVQDRIKLVETFYEMDEEGNKRQLTDEQRRKTDKLVQNMIGGYKTFVYTNLFLQQREESFRDMKQASRKDFLYELFGLDGFEKYRKDKEEEMKTAKAEETTLKKRIEHCSEKMWEQNTKHLEERSLHLSQEMEGLQQQLSTLSTQREVCFQQLKPCSYKSLDEILTRQRSLEKQERVDSKRMTEAVVEKESCIKYLAQHDVDEVERKIQRHQQEVEEDHALYATYSPLHSSKTLDEWKETYAKVQAQVASFSDISKEWKKKEEVYRQEIRSLQEGKPPHDASVERLSDAREWSFWTEEYEKRVATQEKENQEWDAMEKDPDTAPLPDMEQEGLHLEKLVQEVHKVACQYDMARKLLVSEEGVTFNKNCTSCMNNPHYLQRKQNAVEAKRLKTRGSVLQKECETSWTRLSSLLPLESSIPSATGWEDALEKVRARFHAQRQKQQHYCARKQEILASRKAMALFETQYKNTMAYRKARKVDLRIAKLEKQMVVDPLGEQFKRVLLLLEEFPVYTRLDALWKNCHEGGLGKFQEIASRCRQYQTTLSELELEIKELTERTILCRVDKEKLVQEKEWWEENAQLYLQIQQFDKEKSVTETSWKAKEEEFREVDRTRSATKAQQEQWLQDKRAYDDVVSKRYYLERLTASVERDGLPLFLLQKKLPMVEADVNALLSPFLQRKLVLCVEDKDVVVGIETVAESKKVSNYLGGMESFIVDLSLKLAFSKFANLPRSNLFIIDEGISVLDQERISNISHLFDFLSNITDHVLLISHLPAIKDFVHQSIEVLKEEATQKSRMIMG